MRSPCPHLRILRAAAHLISGASLLLTASSCRDAPRVPLEEGVSEELAQLRDSTLSELRYRYDLRIPETPEEPVEGRMEVRLRWDDPERRPLVLDFMEPGERIRDVRVNGEEAPWDTAFDHLIIPPERLQRGVVNRIHVAFTAGDEALNRNPDFLYTLFVPDRAHFSLPVIDQPSLKGRFAVTLDVPAGWKAIANGPLEGRPEEEVDASPGEAGVGEGGAGGEESAAEGEPASGRATWTFGETEPIPSYLFAFAAGDFREATARRAGRSIRFLHRETDSARVDRNLEAIFDLHGTALAWLEEYTGIEYPFQSFGMVAVPSFQYGGMEHPGQILYRASTLFLDASATQNDHLRRASLIAHETAHMWFGNLVTMAWFDDVWTKEVFANFFAAKIVHPSFPDVDHDLRFVLAHHPTAYAVDRTPGANPVRQPLDNLKEAGTLYGAIIYQKAPVVMRQLERLVGEEAFRRGMGEYLRAHAYGNATWPDLIRSLDGLGREDLDSWSRSWVQEPGRPVVSAFQVVGDSADPRLTELTLMQEDPAGKGRVWAQPLRVLMGWGPDSLRAVDVDLLGEAEAVPGAAVAPRPAFVLPDVSGVGYGHMHLDEGSRRWLLEHLFELRDPMARGVGLVTLHDALMEGEVDPGAYLDLLLEGTELEESELVIEELLGNLRTTFWRFLTPDQRGDRAGGVEGALWAGVLEAESGSEAAAFFRAFRDVAVTGDAVRLLGEVWAGERAVPEVTLSEEDRATLALELAVREADGWERILAAQEAAMENPDRKARFAFVSPSVDTDPAIREAFFRSLLEPENREQEPWVLVGMGYLNHPLRQEHARRFLHPVLEEVWEVQRTGDIFFPKRWLDAALGGHQTAEAADTVQAFLDRLPPEYPSRLRGKIVQSADPLFRAARMIYGREG